MHLMLLKIRGNSDVYPLGMLKQVKVLAHFSPTLSMGKKENASKAFFLPWNQTYPKKKFSFGIYSLMPIRTYQIAQ